MAYTTIDDPSAHFQVKIYEGTSGIHNVTLDGNSDMQPDLVWLKNRDVAYVPHMYDSNRGTTKALYPSGNNAEATITNGLTQFQTDGFRVTSAAAVNEDSMVCWCWKANGGTTSSNTDGDLTSTVQFNSTAKFSIITYTGKDPIEPLDIGHGMGEAPDVVWVKNRDRSITWGVYHKDLTSPAENRYIALSSDIAESANSTVWRNEAPTTSIIKTGESAILNQPNEKIVMYAWKSVQGFSKFGKYTGNGNADGAFIYTGFKPALVIIKVISNAGYQWWLTDNERNPHNEMDKWIFPDLDNAEYNGAGASKDIDFVSNGFKLRASDDGFNGSGKTYVYFAWAENPFTTSTGVPCTAR